MRQRIALGGAGVAAALGLLLIWAMSLARPVSAMEKMAEEIRKVKSYKATHIGGDEIAPSSESGEPIFTPRTKGTVYWLAPGSTREDFGRTGPEAWDGPGPETTFITPYPHRRPQIGIHHRSKFFHRDTMNTPEVDTNDDPWQQLSVLAKFSGKADRDLGTKEIEGKQAHGFEIDCKKLMTAEEAAKADWHGTWEIWIDTASNLPVFVRVRMVTVRVEGEGEDHGFQQFSDFQWNIDLDPKLFDPTPPAGYTDLTPKPPISEEEVRSAIEALKTYAEASGGHYPPDKVVNEFKTGHDLCKMLGVEDDWPRKYPKQTDAGNAGKAAKASVGFAKIFQIQVYVPDAAYYGKTVGPGDKGKVLLRWKIDDGRYGVIFGDLRFETVTAERLHALEGK